MPIYEYRCSSCGYEKEYLRKVSDPLLTQCPECGKPTFDKLVSAAGFQLKGNGWYVTDFKDKGKKPATEAKSSGGKEKSADSDKSSADKKSDDKPAEKKQEKTEA